MVPLVDVTYDHMIGEDDLRRLAECLPDLVAEAVDCPEEPWTGPAEAGDIEVRFHRIKRLTDVVVRLWKLDPTTAPRAVWLMTNTFLALAALKLTLLDLPRFLLNKPYRDKLLSQLPPNLHLVRTYFTQEFPKTPGGARQWALPILNKLGGLLFDSDIRLMVSGSPALDFRQMMDDRMILLVNLPKGILGEDTSSLMAAFVVAIRTHGNDGAASIVDIELFARNATVDRDHDGE